jgi:hypothetical protein
LTLAEFFFGEVERASGRFVAQKLELMLRDAPLGAGTGV